MDFFDGKRIIVTGAAGTVGSQLVRTLLKENVAEIRAIDNSEQSLFTLSEELGHEPRFHPFLCDIRHESRLSLMFRNMDYCVHAAALKHVTSSERAPFEAVQTNIVGVQNVIQAAMENNLRRVLFTSSDKAVNPTNVMGTSKLMGERLITAANAMTSAGSKVVFSSVRFGNVAGSSGSAVPLFCGQIARGGPVTLTDGRMTRFFMSLNQCVRLVMQSLHMARGGEVFVTRMRCVRVPDLIEHLIELVAPVYGLNPGKIEIRNIGPRPGEKLCEELTTEEELRRTVQCGELFAVLPAFRNIYNSIQYDYPDARPAEVSYNSATEMPANSEELQRFLLLPGVLPEAIVTKLVTRELPWINGAAARHGDVVQNHHRAIAPSFKVAPRQLSEGSGPVEHPSD